MTPPRILVVEDDRDQLDFLQAVLEIYGYIVQRAESGEEALAQIQALPPDLILLDGMLPGMDGFETCQQIRAVHAWTTIPIVMVTGLSSHEERIRALRVGAQDFLTKPFNDVELRARVANLLKTKELYDQLAQQNAELQNEINERKRTEAALAKAREQEVDIGFKIQQSLLLGSPPTDFPPLQVAVHTTPSQRIDGDFYDFFRHGDHTLDVIVGDVMGKGVPAALLGAATKSQLLRAMNELVRTQPETIPTPQQILQAVHARVIQQFIELESFVTLLYARFDLLRRQVALVDCGHTRMIHVQARSGVSQFCPGVNLPLGCLEEERYQEISVPFESGDVFVVYSDGVTETRNHSGEPFGEERLASVVAAHGRCSPSTLIEKIRHAVVTFAQTKTFGDDFTCVVVKIAQLERLPPLAQKTLNVTSEVSNLAHVRAFVRAFCQTLCLSWVAEADICQLELAVTEAVSNIIRHAYAGRPGKRIEVEATAFPDHVALSLSHWGIGFDPASVPLPAFDGTEEGGFGMYIIDRCVSQVTYTCDEQGKHSVCLRKQPPAAPPQGALSDTSPPLQPSAQEKQDPY